MAESKILTEALTKVDLLFGLRQTLQNYGVPCTEPLKITIKCKGKEYECKEFPALQKPMTPQLIQKDLKDTVVEFMNKADVLDNIYEKLELNDTQEDVEVKVILEYGEKFNNRIVSRVMLCYPCPFGNRFCCVC